MVKEKQKIGIGSLVVIVALVFIFMGTVLSQVKAAQGNHTYHFVFGYEGDTKVTGMRDKWYSYDEAYIDCTYAENEDANFNATFCFMNRDDGTQYSSAVTLWNGSRRWVYNGAAAGDQTWFDAQLNSGGYYEDEGGIFEGSWRPDSSSY